MVSSESYGKGLDRLERKRALLWQMGLTVAAAMGVTCVMWEYRLYRHLISASRAQHVRPLPGFGASAAFGEPVARRAAATPQVLYRSVVTSPGINSSVQKTPEKLILTGTVVGATPEGSSAFIGIDARHPQTYGIGALLVNGLRLVGIFKDYVILGKGDTRTRLYLTGTVRAALYQPNGAMLMVGGLSARTAATASTDDVFSDFVRPAPVFAGSTVTGYRVYPGRNGAVFFQMGLRPGDIITSMDGEPLDDPTAAADMFRSLATGDQANAQILREGKTVEITLDGSVIAKEHEREQEEKYLPPSSAAPGA